LALQYWQDLFLNGFWRAALAFSLFGIDGYDLDRNMAFLLLAIALVKKKAMLSTASKGQLPKKWCKAKVRLVVKNRHPFSAPG